MSTNQQEYKRTKQVRIGLKWHRKIKSFAAERGQTMTEVLERLLVISEAEEDVMFSFSNSFFDEMLRCRGMVLSAGVRFELETSIGAFFDRDLFNWIDEIIESKGVLETATSTPKNTEPHEITNPN